MVFAVQAENFVAYWCGRGTMLIASRVLSPGRSSILSTGAVSRYKFRSEPGNCQGAEL